MAPHVAVIGAGPLGLMAIKNLIEDGFQVTAFEKRAYVGGLWKAATDSSISVVPGTVFNSSRFRSAVTDFPLPENVDDFPTNQQLLTYFQSYASHFNLTKHVKLNAEIKTVAREGGRWALKISYDDSDHLATEYFDKVLVAIGSFITPKIPKLSGIENFKGQTLHSLDFRWDHLSEFDGKNVLLVGLHATAQDVTCELYKHAKKVYIAHKNGVVLLSRYAKDERTFDQAMTLNFLYFQSFAARWFPNLFTWLVDTMMVKMSKAAFPKAKKEWNLLPAPSIATTAPLIADALWPHLESGFAEPCMDVKRVTGPKTIELSDGKLLNDVDTIIYCTGYDFAVPFLPTEFNPYPVPGDSPYLYRNTFSMHQDREVRNSLAFLGHAAIPFPGFAAHEMAAMAVSQTWLGNEPALPSLRTMEKWHANHQKWRQGLLSKQKSHATFYVGFMPVDEHVKWLDKAAGTGLFENFGWFKWRAWRLWWQDKELYYKCKSGLFSPAIWRLFDMGKRKPWKGAREQIFIDNEIADRAHKQRVEIKKREAEELKRT